MSLPFWNTSTILGSKRKKNLAGEEAKYRKRLEASGESVDQRTQFLKDYIVKNARFRNAKQGNSDQAKNERSIKRTMMNYSREYNVLKGQITDLGGGNIIGGDSKYYEGVTQRINQARNATAGAGLNMTANEAKNVANAFQKPGTTYGTRDNNPNWAKGLPSNQQISQFLGRGGQSGVYYPRDTVGPFTDRNTDANARHNRQRLRTDNLNEQLSRPGENYDNVSRRLGLTADNVNSFQVPEGYGTTMKPPGDRSSTVRFGEDRSQALSETGYIANPNNVYDVNNQQSDARRPYGSTTPSYVDQNVPLGTPGDGYDEVRQLQGAPLKSALLELTNKGIMNADSADPMWRSFYGSDGKASREQFEVHETIQMMIGNGSFRSNDLANMSGQQMYEEMRAGNFFPHPSSRHYQDIVNKAGGQIPINMAQAMERYEMEEMAYHANEQASLEMDILKNVSDTSQGIFTDESLSDQRRESALDRMRGLVDEANSNELEDFLPTSRGNYVAKDQLESSDMLGWVQNQYENNDILSQARTDMQQYSNEIADVEAEIAMVESDLRKEANGEAPESYIRAEAARRTEEMYPRLQALQQKLQISQNTIQEEKEMINQMAQYHMHDQTTNWNRSVQSYEMDRQAFMDQYGMQKDLYNMERSEYEFGVGQERQNRLDYQQMQKDAVYMDQAVFNMVRSLPKGETFEGYDGKIYEGLGMVNNHQSIQVQDRYGNKFLQMRDPQTGEKIWEVQTEEASIEQMKENGVYDERREYLENNYARRDSYGNATVAGKKANFQDVNGDEMWITGGHAGGLGSDKNNEGLDYSTNSTGGGTGPVKTHRGGQVTKVVSNCTVGDKSCNGGWGNQVIINSKGKQWMYSHLSQGQTEGFELHGSVAAGQLIGQMGNTGNSTGPHVDLTVKDESGNKYDSWDVLGMINNDPELQTIAQNGYDASSQKFEQMKTVDFFYDQEDQIEATKNQMMGSKNGKQTLQEIHEAIDVYSSMDTTYNQALDGEAAAQLAMIFSFAKILDPSSTVREGEVEEIKKIGGAFSKNAQKISNFIKNEGQPLPEGVIQALYDWSEPQSMGKLVSLSNKIDPAYGAFQQAYGSKADSIMPYYSTLNNLITGTGQSSGAAPEVDLEDMSSFSNSIIQDYNSGQSSSPQGQQSSEEYVDVDSFFMNQF